MEFRLKGLLNLDSALSGVLTAAEMKIAVATTIASSAMVVSSVDLEVKNHSAVQIEIQDSKVVPAEASTSRAESIYVPVAQSDSYEQMAAFSEAREFDQSAVDSYQSAAKRLASANPASSISSVASSSPVRSGVSKRGASRGTRSVRPSRRSSRGSIGSGSASSTSTRATPPARSVSTAGAAAPAAPSVSSSAPGSVAEASGAGAGGGVAETGVSSSVVSTIPPAAFGGAGDSSGSSSTTTVSSSGGGSKGAVSSTNSAPVASATCAASVAQDVAYSCTPAVTDSDSGDTQTWTLDATNDCAWAVIDSSSGAVSGAPNDDQVGSCTLAFKSNDGSEDSNVLSSSVTVTNVAPTLTIANAASIVENVAATVIRADADVQANEETFGSYSFDHATTSGTKCDDNKISLSIDSTTGAVTYQPAASYTGTCNIKVSFDDGNSGVVSDEFSITVTPPPPTLTIADAINLPVNSSAATIRADADVQASAEGAAGSVYSLDNATTTTPKCDDNKVFLIIDANTGAVTYQPAASYTGTCNVKVHFDDGSGGSVSEEFAISVMPTTPTLDLNLTNCSSLPGSLSLTRATSGSYMDTDGRIKTAASGAARCDHDPLTGEPLGLLIEQASENLLLQTMDIENATWVKTDAVAAMDLSVSTPDGGISKRFFESATTSEHKLEQSVNFASSGAAYTFSVYVRSAGGRDVVLRLPSSVFAAGPSALCDLGAETVTPTSADNATLQKINDSWYRCSVTATSTSTGTASVEVVTHDGTSTVFLGSGGFGFYLWGAQVEASTVPTSYIATTTATVSRDADDFSYSDVTWYNDEAGTFVTQSHIPYVRTGSVNAVFEISDGSTANNLYQVALANNRNTFGATRSSTADLLVNGALDVWSSEDHRRSAIGYYSTNSHTMYSNGVLAGSDTSGSVPSSIDRLYIGRRTSGSYLNGHVRRLSYYPMRLENLDLNNTSANTAPSLSYSCSAAATDGVAYACSSMTLTDPDSLDVHYYYLDTTNTCAWAAVDSITGSISGTPNNSQVGACTVAVRVADGYTVSGATSFAVTVSNSVPTLTIADASAILEDAAATNVRAGADVQASEEGHGTYSLIAATAPDCQSHAITATVHATTGRVRYEPAADYNGTCNFNVQFDDGNGGVVSDEFAVPVTAVNDAPTITWTCPTSLNQDAALSCSAGPAVSDPDTGDSHTWGFVGAHDCLWASINSSTGVISGTPNDDEVGTCTLAIRATDGTANSNILSQSVTVNNVAPTLTIANATAISEDASTTTVRASGTVDANEEGFGTYSLIAATAPDCRNNEIFSGINTNTGRVDYQPAANYNGTCNFNVQFDDGNGGTVSDEFSVTVNAVNDVPVITATCPTSLNEDVAYACSVAPGVTDPDTGDTHTWSLDGTNTCAWASIHSSTGVVSGTPNNGHVGACTLAFKTNDGTVDSNVISQSVTVNNVAATLTIADAANLNVNHRLFEIRADADIQANDEGSGTYSFDHATTTSPKCDDNKISLTINTANGVVFYEPSLNYSGTCNVKVEFDDGNGSTVSDEFAVAVVAASPTLDLSFTNCGSFPGAVTFTRASTATYFDSSGVLQTAALNAPRCDYDAFSLSALGLLVEESRENVFLRSEEVDNALWTAHGLAATVTDNVVAAPDGNTTAEKVDDVGTIAVQSIRQSYTGVADSETWTCSAFVKLDAGDAPTNSKSSLRCRIFGGTTAVAPYLEIDWSTHTVSSFDGTPDAIGIKRYANDWYRVWMTVTNNATGNNQITSLIAPAHDSSHDAVPTGAIYVWGVQVEKGASPTSYIPTTSATVTRAADVANITNMTFFDADQGTFLAEAQAPVLSTLRQTLFEVNDGTSTNYHRHYFNGSGVLTSDYFRSSASQSTDAGLGAVSADTAVKYGVSYASDGTTMSQDGVFQGNSSMGTLPAPLTGVYVGRDVDGKYLNGHVKTLKYWNYRLGDTALNSQ